MVVLSDESIRDRLNFGELEVSPLSDPERQIQPCSLDLRLGNNYYTMPPTEENHREGVSLISFEPGEFVLGTTEEWVSLPDDLSAMVKGRSSIGRKGVQVHNAGWVDSGYEGELTLELINFTDEAVVLPVGQRVCQLVFMPLDQEPTRSYATKQGSKYQGQSGATPSRLEREME